MCPTKSQGKTPKPADFKPEPFFKGGKPRCMAWSRTAGKQCGNRPVKGKRVCRFHGATAGRPPKAGRKFNLMGQYQELADRLAADPTLFELRSEMVVSSARLSELVDRASTAKPAPDGAAFGKELARCKAAARFGEKRQVEECLDRMTELLSEANSEKTLWDEIREQLRVSKEISQSERGTLIKVGGTLPLAIVEELIVQVTSVFLRNIPRDANRRKVINDLQLALRSEFPALPAP